MHANEEVTQSLAESWAEKGDQHRALAFSLAHTSLQKASVEPPQTWRDVELADRIARRAAGLDEGSQTVEAKFSLQLIHQRMEIPPTVAAEYLSGNNKTLTD